MREGTLWVLGIFTLSYFPLLLWILDGEERLQEVKSFVDAVQDLFTGVRGSLGLFN
jgi:hypothetical protein